MRTEPLIVALIGAGIVVAVLGGYLRTSQLLPPRGCTMEAKVCPDGSTVGRTGPNCEFAACPGTGTTTPAGPVTLTAQLNETVSGLGVSITPTKVVEDSRCPIDVECIQAGTVRVETSLSAGMGTAPQTFTLNKPVTTEAETVTLTAVSPARRAGVSIGPGDYRFIFTVEKRPTSGGILPYNSGIRGAVVLGPTCPVERTPPLPQCADKPYATTISVSHTGSSSVFATTQSGANGIFELSLPPGTYTVSAQGGNTLPRCASQDVTVAPTGYVTITISCDTGIR